MVDKSSIKHRAVVTKLILGFYVLARSLQIKDYKGAGNYWFSISSLWYTLSAFEILRHIVEASTGYWMEISVWIYLGIFMPVSYCFDQLASKKGKAFESYFIEFGSRNGDQIRKLRRIAVVYLIIGLGLLPMLAVLYY